MPLPLKRANHAGLVAPLLLRRWACGMRPLRYSINVTLVGCCDPREASAMQKAQMTEGRRGEARRGPTTAPDKKRRGPGRDDSAEKRDHTTTLGMTDFVES